MDDARPIALLFHGAGDNQYTWAKTSSFLRDLQSMGLRIFNYTAKWNNVTRLFDTASDLDRKEFEPDIAFSYEYVEPESHCRFIRGQLRELFPQGKIVLIAHSFGHLLAQTFARLFPKECLLVVVVDGIMLGRFWLEFNKSEGFKFTKPLKADFDLLMAKFQREQTSDLAHKVYDTSYQIMEEYNATQNFDQLLVKTIYFRNYEFKDMKLAKLRKLAQIQSTETEQFQKVNQDKFEIAYFFDKTHFLQQVPECALVMTQKIRLLLQPPLLTVAVSRSTLTPDSVLKVIHTNFVFSADTKILLTKSGTNDTYFLESSLGKCMCTVWSRGNYHIQGADDLLFVMDILDRLQDCGHVPRVVRNRADSYLAPVMAPEGSRHLAICSWAPGAPADFVPEQCHAWGVALATVHKSMTNLVPRYKRAEHMQLYTLLAKPALVIKRYKWADQKTLIPLFVKMATDVLAFSKQAKDDQFGLIHGDNNMTNVIFDSQTKRATLIDWEFCSFGWRIHDVAEAKRNLLFWGDNKDNLSTKKQCWKYFLDGYNLVRKLTAEEMRICNSFLMASQFWAANFVDENGGDEVYWKKFTEEIEICANRLDSF